MWNVKAGLTMVMNRPVLPPTAQNAHQQTPRSPSQDLLHVKLPSLAEVVEGDCTSAMKSMDRDSVTLVIADPPYEGVVSEKWDCVRNYMKFSRAWITEAVRILRPGGALLVFGSPERNWISRISVMLEDEMGMNLVQHLCWVYNQGGGSRVSTMAKRAVQHELLIWFEKPGPNRTFNAHLGVEHYTDDDRAIALSKGKGRVTDTSLDRGRPARSFLDFPRENSRSKERKYGHHPCMKPLDLCSQLVALHSNPCDKVFIPFAGSGSELLSAAKLGRIAQGVEINREYIELMKKRFLGHACSLTVSTGD